MSVTRQKEALRVTQVKGCDSMGLGGTVHTYQTKGSKVKGCSSMGSEEERVRTHHLLRAASVEQCDLAAFSQS